MLEHTLFRKIDSEESNKYSLKLKKKRYIYKILILEINKLKYYFTSGFVVLSALISRQKDSIRLFHNLLEL